MFFYAELLGGGRVNCSVPIKLAHLTCTSLIAGATSATKAAISSPGHRAPWAAIALSARATTHQLMSTADSSARRVEPRSHIVHFTGYTNSVSFGSRQIFRA